MAREIETRLSRSSEAALGRVLLDVVARHPSGEETDEVSDQVRGVLLGSDVVIVRVPMGELVRLNADRLRLCAVNSGQTGARMKMVPRGPDTYGPLERFAGTRRDVKELVFHDHAALPASRALLDIDLVLSSAG